MLKTKCPCRFERAVPRYRNPTSVQESIGDGDAQAMRLLGIGKLYHRIDQCLALIWMMWANSIRALLWRLRGVGCVKAMGAFLHVPAIIAALDDNADFLPQMLPRVYCKEAILSCPVKGQTIRVAKPICVNLIEPCPTNERVVLRNPVRSSCIHINAQNCPQEVLGNILAIPTCIELVPVRRVTRGVIVVGAPIAERNVEKTIIISALYAFWGKWRLNQNNQHLFAS
jgi:hypothetical protein